MSRRESVSLAAEGAILVGYPADLREQQAAIEERWNAAFGR